MCIDLIAFSSSHFKAQSIIDITQEIYKVVENRLSSRQNSGHKMNDMLDSFLSRGMTLEQATSELVVVL